VSNEVDVVERVLALLQEGTFTTTYKHAVLLALMDLCLVSTTSRGLPAQSVTTRQLAERVIELYWPQTRPWGDSPSAPVLVQNAGVSATSRRGRARILQRVEEFRRDAQRLGGAGTSAIVRARNTMPDAYDRLVDQVEWTLIEMPLPKLQRVGGHDTRWLYDIAWDDGDSAPKKRDVTRYQRGTASTFANDIRFKPGVAEAFARLHGILRPFVQQQWTSKVAALNGLEEARLGEFLFGVSRTPPTPIRKGLVELQSGACFFCGNRIRGTAQIDHFIPWARHPDDSLVNLVAADSKCNNSKSDFLAASTHLEHWHRRADQQRDALRQVADEHAWTASDRILGVARAIYLGLPADGRLWTGGDQFEQVNKARLKQLLAA